MFPHFKHFTFQRLILFPVLGLTYLFSETPNTTKSPCRSPVKSLFAIDDSFSPVNMHHCKITVRMRVSNIIQKVLDFFKSSCFFKIEEDASSGFGRYSQALNRLCRLK
uniref:Uncharacterized protein n=1 Tax=virus sp. ctHG14 TaxID=2827626 RepID=A0A8S5RIQ5_9VIRU|nr:MAG TPA: hypothetical protein [virus sp. ctHG14]